MASAAGLLAARPRADAVRVLVSDVDAVDWARVEALYRDMAAQMKDSLGDRLDVDARWEFQPAADMRYRGQTDTVSVPLPEEGGMPVRDSAAMQELFEQAYEKRYLRKIENVAAEVAAWAADDAGSGPSRHGRPAAHG